jgi:hypothetical protein
MADHVCSKPLTQVEEVCLDDAQPSPTMSLALTSLPVELGDEPMDGCVLEGVLSDGECKRLLESAERSGFSFWDANGVSKRSLAVRNADTLEFECVSLCSVLWERLRAHVPERVEISEEQPRFEPDLEGSWRACGLNTHLLLNRYGGGGHFAPHVDGSTIVDFNRRSLYTVLLYLNECEEGGATQLLRAEQGEATQTDGTGASIARETFVVHAVRPVCGRGLLYWHQVLHAGERVGPSSVKYCLRTDVMYERDPPICTEPNDVQAFELCQAARALEANGRAMDALPLYMRARKLSRGIAKAFRL